MFEFVVEREEVEHENNSHDPLSDGACHIVGVVLKERGEGAWLAYYTMLTETHPLTGSMYGFFGYFGCSIDEATPPTTNAAVEKECIELPRAVDERGIP